MIVWNCVSTAPRILTHVVCSEEFAAVTNELVMSVWTEAKDGKGQTYFWNRDTDEVRWQPPGQSDVDGYLLERVAAVGAAQGAIAQAAHEEFT